MRVLAVNLGSSSLRLSVVDEADRVCAAAHVDTDVDAVATLRDFAAQAGDVGAVAHRLVLAHGDAHALGTAALPALARRLADIADWTRSEPRVAGHPCGCLAAGF
jgi:acetate kinase